jgi:hypothetical protein
LSVRLPKVRDLGDPDEPLQKTIPASSKKITGFQPFTVEAVYVWIPLLMYNSTLFLSEALIG